jgi:hypothetical protein
LKYSVWGFVLFNRSILLVMCVYIERGYATRLKTDANLGISWYDILHRTGGIFHANSSKTKKREKNSQRLIQ